MGRLNYRTNAQPAAISAYEPLKNCRRRFAAAKVPSPVAPLTPTSDLGAWLMGPLIAPGANGGRYFSIESTAFWHMLTMRL
jgi:hypothetical protein